MCLQKIPLIVVLIAVALLYLIYYFSTLTPLVLRSRQIVSHDPLIISSENEGWISSSLYDQFRSYILSRDETLSKMEKRISVNNGTVTTLPLKSNYIEHLQNVTPLSYRYSTWKCSRTSVSDFENAGEYCFLTNIYYNAQTDNYYYYRNPAENRSAIPRTMFKTPFDEIELVVIDDITRLPAALSAILTRPVLVAAPPDLNYAHGFLELCGPRFWVLAECQSHASYVNPNTTQIYYTSSMLKGHQRNWELYERQPDGTYLPLRKWEKLLQSMFSSYPLLIYTSFDERTVMFKYMIFPGRQLARSPAWGYSYLERVFQSHPLPTVHYRRAYLAYSEWILYHFNLTSKFQLTPAQEELQKTKGFEQIPICVGSCAHKRVPMSVEGYTGEWIVVLNRPGHENRELLNGQHLVDALLEAFPDHSNPYLRVWPHEFFFSGNFDDVARMSRSIRLLIGVHGAGLANTLFMRPGAILYEINPYACRHLSFNFRRWAEVFNLQHALWIPSSGEKEQKQNICRRESGIMLDVRDIIDEVKNLLRNEIEYRNGYWKRALDIINDLSVVDHPPPEYKSLLS